MSGQALKVESIHVEKKHLPVSLENLNQQVKLLTVSKSHSGIVKLFWIFFILADSS